ncbi:hypothetical protein [Meiothermus sp. CFH 77666]|nr:hypothetical protein [Meiothermus sp. CFH 77666]
MRRKWLVLGLVLALLAACGGGSPTPQGTWDNSSWDAATWQ